MKYGVYLSHYEDKLVLIEPHPKRKDRFYLSYFFRDEVHTDPLLIIYFKEFMKGRYTYLSPL